MENIIYNGKEYTTKFLGIVTLYNPDPMEVAENILRYIQGLDSLIIWDNSPLENSLKDKLKQLLGDDEWEKVIWHGTGENLCIAKAINYAWQYGIKYKFDLLLVMDQDSKWKDFNAYRNDVQRLFNKGEICVYTPYVLGCDNFPIINKEQEKHLIINSGMFIPFKILTDIGGVDERAFPLDALDHDIAYTIREHGFRAICLTDHKLDHSLGQLQRMGLFNIMTPNYNWQRTYSMTRSHIICYLKHKKVLTDEDRHYLYWEILIMKFTRIILAEPDKFKRMKAFIKGILDGLSYKR